MEAKSTVGVVRLPKPLLEPVDRLARAQYLTRSEAMRALMRKQIERAANHSITRPRWAARATASVRDYLIGGAISQGDEYLVLARRERNPVGAVVARRLFRCE